MTTHPRMLNDRHGPLQVKIARSVYALHVLMCLLQAPTEEIFYLILSQCLRSQKFFSGLKTSRNKSSTTSPNGITSFFNKSD